MLIVLVLMYNHNALSMAFHEVAGGTAIKTVIDYVSITMLFAYIIMMIETLILRKKKAMPPY